MIFFFTETVKSIPLTKSFIENNGLHMAVTGIRDKSRNEILAKFVHGCRGKNRKVHEALKKYSKGKLLLAF